MQKQFEKFCENIRLTLAQREDAKKKYAGVCRKLHDNFYDCEYSGKTKLIFGSYAKVKRTAIRPFSEDQDVDVLFKIPEDVFKQYYDYEEGGQSALLQKIRAILLDSKYALGEKPKAWGKVILIKTTDGTHNIELLPAFELDDGSFEIPNTEDGGSWDIFNPRSELEKFRKSNEDSDGFTAILSRMIKRWAQEVQSVTIKSYQIENFVIDFLDQYDFSAKNYSEIVKDFFEYLNEKEDVSHIETAKKRSSKAFEFEKEEKFENATDEWKKIFGESSFPSRVSVYRNDFSEVSAPKEEFIENKFPVRINADYVLKIDCEITQDGWRAKSLLSSIKFLLREKKLEFFIKYENIPEPFSVMWKVRNFGKEAEDADDLRGQIYNDEGYGRRNENSKYLGEHFVECYIIKDGACVARSKIMVPIGKY
jgi:hypothetical protein